MIYTIPYHHDGVAGTIVWTGRVRCEAEKDRSMTTSEARTRATATPATTDGTTDPAASDTTNAVVEAGAEIADETPSAVGQVRDAVGSAIQHVPDLLANARSGAGQVAGAMPDAVERARHGAQGTATTLQKMPDQALRLLAAASIGLAAGLKLAGAPRLVALAAAVPALVVGGAVIARPGRTPGHAEETGMTGEEALDDAKRVVRDVEVEAKKAVRGIDGTDTRDAIGNAGDEVRKDLGNLGDDAREAKPKPKRKAPGA
jgi:hypothetical protein